MDYREANDRDVGPARFPPKGPPEGYIRSLIAGEGRTKTGPKSWMPPTTKLAESPHVKGPIRIPQFRPESDPTYGICTVLGADGKTINEPVRELASQDDPESGLVTPKQKTEKATFAAVDISASSDSEFDRRVHAGQHSESASSALDPPPQVRAGSDLGASRPESCPPSPGEEDVEMDVESPEQSTDIERGTADGGVSDSAVSTGDEDGSAEARAAVRRVIQLGIADRQAAELSGVPLEGIPELRAQFADDFFEHL